MLYGINNNANTQNTKIVDNRPHKNNGNLDATLAFKRFIEVAKISTRVSLLALRIREIVEGFGF